MINQEKIKMEKEGETYDFLQKTDVETRKYLEIYISSLLEYNKKVNIISRKITERALKQLINETFLLETYILNNNIVDAGSGNGLLGIPIAIKNPGKIISLVEPKKKKTFFLEETIKALNLKNVRVYCTGIQEFIDKIENKKFSLVARGFPTPENFIKFLAKKLINEVILITSENKIKNIDGYMVNVKKRHIISQ
jgi:16S rRNA (guanine527-N7)-methyltransferase